MIQRTRHAFPTHLLALSMPCDRPQRQPPGYTISSPYTFLEYMSKPQAWNRYIGFLWNWYYNWALPRTWKRHTIQEKLKQTGKHWSQLRCAYLKYSTLKAIPTWSLRVVKSRRKTTTTTTTTIIIIQKLYIKNREFIERLRRLKHFTT